MGNFLRSLFGSKKSPSKIKPRMQSRRLELLGLEERVTPATVSVSGTDVLITLGAGENISDLNTSTLNAVITVNTVGSANNSTSGTIPTGVTAITNTVTINTAAFTTFTGIQVLGSNTTNAVTVGAAGINLTAGSTANTNQTVAINLSFNSGTGTLNVNGPILPKNAGNVGLNSTTVTIAAAGDITATTGSVNITGNNISTAGDVTTTSGAITYTGNVALVGGNVATTSTLAGGNLSIVGALNLNALKFTANQGLGNVNAFTGAVTGSGALSLTGATVSVGTINSTGAVVTATATTGDLTFGLITSSGCVNAKSSTGDVIFGNTVTTTGVDGFISEATLATKATKIAKAVTVGAGAKALVTGNLISNNSTLAAFTTSGAGNITITGNVDASVANNNLTLTAGSGAITIGGNVGSSSPAMGDLISTGTGLFLASGNVTTHCVNVSGFTTSITFAGDVKTNGVNGVSASTSGAGTLTFSSSITSVDATNTGDIVLKSGSGALSVVGAIVGTNDVTINSVSGNITLSGAISTTGVDSDILIGADSVAYSPGPPATCVYNNPTLGNILLSGDISTTGDGSAILIVTGATGNITTLGSLTTSGGNANADPINQAAILLDPDGPGNITMKGALSTTGGGKILIGVENIGLTAVGGGNLLLDNTVTTTGTVAGSIYIGVSGGTLTVNKAITTGAGGDIAFVTTAPTDLIIIASGANISAGDAVDDYGPGILNLGANITSGTANLAATSGILLDSSAVNLTGAVTLKSIGTGIGSDITLFNIEGAQNLTLEATDGISLGNVGQTTPLNTVTITNSTGVNAGNFTAANVVLADTTGTVAFAGSTVITTSLTTAAKAYNVTFAGTTSLAGTPVFLNTGNVSFAGNTSLISGATITGTAATTVALAGTIVSCGAFNISALPATTTIANATQLILNSTTAGSTFAGKVVSGGTGANALSLLGVGTLTLSGDSSTTGVTGAINVINGTLNVTGKLGSASLSTATNGTISGAGGTIGTLTVNTGTVAPGGTLKTGAVSLNAATNYSPAVLTTTTASNLETISAINLNSATLSLSCVASGLAIGNTFTIINNTAASTVPIVGTFANQPEGSSISAFDASGNTVTFTVSYIGGTGANDVTLTVASVTPQNPTPAAAPQPMVAGQPVLNKFTAVGADAGAGPLVTITFQNGTYVSFFAYAPSFRGGVRVALGDVNGDGSPDIITGAGPGGGPQVNVYNVDNSTGAVSLQTSFFAFDEPFFAGGVYVAAGYNNYDIYDDVVVSAGAGGGPRVQVYAGSATGVVTSSTLNDFFAYSLAFTGGVVVSTGDRNADGDCEVITAPASNGGFNIKSFDVNGTGNSPTLVDNFFAFNDTTSVGGLSLAVGFLNSGNIDDLIVGTTNSAFGVFLDFDTSGIATVPFAGFTGAIRAGVAEDSFGQDYAVALAGPTGGPRISVFSVGATSLNETDNLFVMNPAFTGGLFGTSSCLVPY
jgi:hypothetical protein